MTSHMGGPTPTVREFKAVLPPAARTLYFKDAIGNISSSHARFGLAATEIELRPRYPLLGGWRVCCLPLRQIHASNPSRTPIAIFGAGCRPGRHGDQCVAALAPAGRLAAVMISLLLPGHGP